MAFNFMDSLSNQALEPEYNQSVTENGAVGFRTTGDILLDMNFKISTYRSLSDLNLQYTLDQDLSALINSVPFTEDNLKLILKWIFYVRDVRGGLGERKVFRVLLDRLLNGIEISGINLYQLFKLVAEYGRWDDLIDWIYRQVENNPKYAGCYIGEALQVIKDQLHSDIADSHPSLLAKWLPSENASSKLTRKKAKMMRSLLNMSPKSYRTTLSTLRKRIKIVESQMSQNEWSSIDYNTTTTRDTQPRQ